MLPMTEPMPDTAEDLIRWIDPTIDPANAKPTEQRAQAVARLTDLLVEKPDQVRAVMCLLERTQKDSEHSVVTACVRAFGRIKTISSVGPLIDIALATHIHLFENDGCAAFLQTDDCLRLRCLAIQTLGKLGDNRAIIPLMSLLNDKSENYRIRLAAAESLGKLGDDHAVSPLVDIISDDREHSIYLKESAAKALGMLGDIRALEPLIDVLESKRGIRNKFNFLKEQVIEAIRRIGSSTPKVTDSLLKALTDEAPSIRLAAIDALGDIGDDDCLPALEGMILDKNEDVAFAAISTIFKLGGEDAIRGLLERENLPKGVRDELESYIP
jgi:HEAT repeat protein